jgi:hypothetical protein
MRPWPLAGALVICVAAAVIGSNSLSQFASGVVHPTQTSTRVLRPSYSVGKIPETVCGNNKVLGNGPQTAPADAITVPAGNDSGVNLGEPNTTYWFAPGIHTLGTNVYGQIDPGTGAKYIGAPGAILDGEQRNDYAFGGLGTNVTISYLTVENFGGVGGNQNEGVVNHESSVGWTIDHSTITRNAGAGVMLGSRDTLSYDCLSDNQQYGFNAYSQYAAPSNLVLDHNEFVFLLS